MPTVTYGGRNGQTMELENDEDLIAVRTVSRRSLRTGPVPSPEAEVVEDLDLVVEYPDAGVEVYRRRDGSPSVAAMKSSLQGADNVEFAGRVLVDSTSKQPVLYTENLFLKFDDEVEEADCRQVIADAGLVVKRELDYAPNAWFVAAPEGTGQAVFDIAQQLLERDDVELCHPELIRELGRRTISPRQWHLQTALVNGQTVDASANVAAAHAVTRGRGVVIAVIDDGVDIDHEELSAAGKIVAPRDMTSGDDDPRPARSDDSHGTACAGVACAEGRFQASGVAPEARLMPIRLQSALGSQAEADAFVWAADHGADVISCSWGPADGNWSRPNDPRHDQVVALPDATRLAIDHATTTGRGGKGCVVLFAAGNGREPVANDGYASYPKVLAVAACNDRGRRSVYSDFGPAVFCAFPSSDFGSTQFAQPAPLTPGIFTTDISGPRGETSGGYRDNFGGTSSACPGAAGVAALVLACRPELRRDEVADILARASVRIDTQNGQYVDGRSPFYGFGRLDAAEAVRLATAHGTGSDVVEVTRTFDLPIPDQGQATATLDVTETAELEEVQLTVRIEHTWIGDLVVTLRPPAASGGRAVVVHNRQGGRTRNLAATWGPAEVAGLAALAGRPAAGQWSVEVRDEAREDVGTIRHVGLRLKLKRAGRTDLPDRSAAQPAAADGPPAVNGDRPAAKRARATRAGSRTAAARPART